MNLTVKMITIVCIYLLIFDLRCQGNSVYMQVIEYPHMNRISHKKCAMKNKDFYADHLTIHSIVTCHTPVLFLKCIKH